MNCVRAQQLIRPYLEGVLSDRELEEFLDHVEHCKTCFGELELYFSIYRTLNNVDEKGNYNYAAKLREKLGKSRGYLRVRRRNKMIKVSVILAAQAALVFSFYEMIRMPGGYLDRHRTEIIPVAETEASLQVQPGGLIQEGQPEQTGQAGQPEQTGPPVQTGQAGQPEQTWPPEQTGQAGQPDQAGPRDE